MRLWPAHYRPPVRNFRVDRMIAVACEAYNILPSEFRGHRRFAQFVRPRQAVCYSLRKFRTDLSFPQIARLIGKKDHSTVIHSVHQAEYLKGIDKQFAELCDKLELLA